ncbi:MAG: hypothetical protein OXR68_04660 [Alphaproteobacteria bacterium]|nr:hypothetical protein [Alphaproteobacteria bacterium]MDD9919900.1 hypothetical protein [Alphaproteobacteria bacterium]
MTDSNNKKCCGGSGFACPITGFSLCCKPQIIIGMVIMAVWFTVVAWVWHGMIMADMYQQTANLWRPHPEMQSMLGWLNGGIILMAVIAAIIFKAGFTNTGWREGLRFGILFTLLVTGVMMITYATQPVPAKILQMWVIGDFISYAGGGILLSFWYGRKSCCKGDDTSCEA